MIKQTYHVKSPFAPAIANFPNKSYIVPMWLEVPIGTELSQVTWEKDIPSPKSDPNIFEVPSSDGKGFYQVQKVGVKWTCNCQGYWRSKDRICKHIKQVNK
jgi:hypothetical protein